MGKSKIVSFRLPTRVYESVRVKAEDMKLSIGDYARKLITTKEK